MRRLRFSGLGIPSCDRVKCSFSQQGCGASSQLAYDNRLGKLKTCPTDPAQIVPLGPTARFFQRLARFQKALKTRENPRPSTRDSFDELGAGFVHLVYYCELD